MDKIERSTNAYLSHVYESPKHPASFSGLGNLYRIAKKEFPSITHNEIKQWAETNLSYSLYKLSRRNFKRNMIYAPEIDSSILRSKEFNSTLQQTNLRLLW